MRFCVGPFVFSCFALCLLAASGRTRAEPPKPAAAVPIVAEAIHAPTDLAGLRKKVGRRVVIEGKIVGAVGSLSGATSYLYFTKNYRESVSLVFLSTSGAKGFAAFDQLGEFIGKKIHIGGLIQERNGALQMRVFDLEQIKVLP